MHRTPATAGVARSVYDLGAFVRTHGPSYCRDHPVPARHLRVLDDMASCRTAALGGHRDTCSSCDFTKVSYNSCRNRHCPKCQFPAQQKWIEQRRQRTLPVHHFHVVFTLPGAVRPIARANPAVVYGLLFRAAAQTLLTLGKDRLDAQVGVTSVLHTWRRDLGYHPHVHCVVTGGGLAVDRGEWVATRPNHLFPVAVMRKLFRGKFLAGLVAAQKDGKLKLKGTDFDDPRVFATLRRQLYKAKWVVYAKRPFGGAKQVFGYLGLYTHRVGIANSRVVNANQASITFRTRGERTVTLTPTEFIRRLLLHVLPHGFHKIRHYGLLAPGNVNTRLVQARSILESDPPCSVDAAAVEAPADKVEVVSDDMVNDGPLHKRICPCCGERTLVRIHLTPHRQTLRPIDSS